MNNFIVDEKIKSSCFFVNETVLNNVYLKNNSLFPWIILVPKINNIYELSDISVDDWLIMREDIIYYTNKVKKIFMSQKINIGSIGNIVKQLHIHIIGRSESDPCWPNSVWHESTPQTPYDQHNLDKIISALK